MQPILLLTRPRAQSLAFADQCRAAGVSGDIVISPIMRIEGRPLPQPPQPGTVLIFTSANGVRHAAARTDLSGFRAVAVGEATAQAARAAGLRCTVADGDADSLFDLLNAACDMAPLLHLRGAHATGDLVARLRAAGRQAESVVVYDQVACPLDTAGQSVLAGRAPVVLPMFSPRSARLLAVAAQGAVAPLSPIAISAATAQAWARAPAPLVPDRPDGALMLAAVVASMGSGGPTGSALVARDPKS